MPDPTNLAGLYELVHQRMKGELRQPAGSVVFLEHDEASRLLARKLVKPAPSPQPAAPASDTAPTDPPPGDAPPAPSAAPASDTAPTDPPPGDAPPAPSGLPSPIPNKAEKTKRSVP